MNFTCYYEDIRFDYFKNHLNQNGFKRIGSHIDGMRKVAAFIGEGFNVYIDCIDREYPLSAQGTVKHANGKPFLYLKTAYSPIESLPIINIIEEGGGKIEPFFKWCGANLGDGFLGQLYPRRKEFIDLCRRTEKEYDVGFCCGLTNHAVPKVSALRTDFCSKFGGHLGGRFFHHEKLKYMKYINASLKWKLSFNCPGVGEYTSRIMDACSIGIPPLLSQTTYDNALSWKGYFPEIDFTGDTWEEELDEVLVNYKEWGEKSLFYYENYWTSQAIFNYLMKRIEAFRGSVK